MEQVIILFEDFASFLLPRAHPRWEVVKERKEVHQMVTDHTTGGELVPRVKKHLAFLLHDHTLDDMIDMCDHALCDFNRG